MKIAFVRAAAIAAAAVGSLTFASSSYADNVVMPAPQQPPVQTTTQPAGGPTIVNNTPGPAVQQPVGTTQTTAASPPVVVANGGTTVPAERPREEYGGPNPALLWSGAVMLGVSYGTAAIVGASSTLDADRNLLVPVLGPWIDLADRPHCGSLGERACGDETAAKVGIGIDGIFQGLGALQIAGAFIWPAHHVTTTTTTTARAEKVKPTFRVTPQRFGYGAYGVGAVGTF